MKDMWKRDCFLRDLDQRAAGKKIVSFDIFDTLLFRGVAQPVDLFEILGRESAALGYLDADFSPKIFKEIRRMAESTARKIQFKRIGAKEINLFDIYKYMPSVVKAPYKIMLLEIEMEKRYCYLNPSVYSAIRYLSEKDVDILLVSDMYLTAGDIEGILTHNGFDMRFVRAMFISNEVYKSKANGSMYEYMLKLFPDVQPSEILHIGDNVAADIKRAQEYGIDALHYAVVPQTQNYNIFEREKISANGRDIPEVLSLRKLGLYLDHNDYNERDRFWYQLGFTVIGPFLSVITDWVLKMAEKENIKTIYPIMRDGEILSHFLKNCIEYQNLDIRVELMQASRESFFLAAASDVGKNKFEGVSDSLRRKVKELFALFKIEEYSYLFSDHLEQEISVLRKTDAGNFKRLFEFFMSDELQEIVQQRADENKKLAAEYIKQFGEGSRFMTFDASNTALIPTYMTKIIQDKTINPIHVIINLRSDDVCGKGIFIGSDIRPVFPRLIADYVVQGLPMCTVYEVLTASDKGRCYGYKRVNGRVEPVLRKNDTSPEQIKNISVKKERWRFKNFFCAQNRK